VLGEQPFPDAEECFPAVRFSRHGAFEKPDFALEYPALSLLPGRASAFSVGFAPRRALFLRARSAAVDIEGLEKQSEP
jgi:hypothetical protein